MVTKKRYFISIDKQTVSEVSVPDTVEYEVFLSPSEVKEFRQLVQDGESDQVWFALQSFVIEPFREDDARDYRNQENKRLLEIYQFIYDHGTPETKLKLTDMGFHPELF